MAEEEDVPRNKGTGSPLADRLYWYAEKLMWGYEGVETNQEEALKILRRAAALGSSDALIRIGQSHEYGRGAPPHPQAALRSYIAAARAGNIVGLAFAAKLVLRTSHLQKAEALWSRFFAAFIAEPDATFVSASRGELLHDYITVHLRLGLEPGHTNALFRHRLEIVGHHQHLLEHAADERMRRLDGTSEWIKLNLGPWPL